MIKVYPIWYLCLTAITVLLIALPPAPNPEVGTRPALFIAALLNIGMFVGTGAAWHIHTVDSNKQ